MPSEKLTLTLPLAGEHARLLAACAAYYDQTPEEYALEAVRSCLVGSMEAMLSAMQPEG